MWEKVGAGAIFCIFVRMYDVLYIPICLFKPLLLSMYVSKYVCIYICIYMLCYNLFLDNFLISCQVGISVSS